MRIYISNQVVMLWSLAQERTFAFSSNFKIGGLPQSEDQLEEYVFNS